MVLIEMHLWPHSGMELTGLNGCWIHSRMFWEAQYILHNQIKKIYIYISRGTFLTKIYKSIWYNEKSGIWGFSFYGISVSQTGLVRPVKENQMEDFKTRWFTKPLAAQNSKGTRPSEKIYTFQGDVLWHLLPCRQYYGSWIQWLLVKIKVSTLMLAIQIVTMHFLYFVMNQLLMIPWAQFKEERKERNSSAYFYFLSNFERRILVS